MLFGYEYVRRLAGVFAVFEFMLQFAECVYCVVDVLHGVCCGRYDAEHDRTFRYDRIFDYRAEYAVVFSEVDDHVECFVDGCVFIVDVGAFEVDWGDRRLSVADVESVADEAFLESGGDLPEVLAVLWLCADYLESFDGALDHGHRE